MAAFLGLCIGSAFAETSRFNLTYGDETIRLDIYNPQRSYCPVVILIHGAAGIEGDRAERYRGFATDLMDNGFIAINVYYFDTKSKDWVKTIIEAISYAENIPNANKDKIGLVGYSLGGTIGLKVASRDSRVKVLAINAGYLPDGFTKEDAANLPKTFMISGSKDTAMDTLNTLKQWLTDLSKPFQTQINSGLGHDDVPLNVLQENWEAIVRFMKENL